jgi:hypothetical protein
MSVRDAISRPRGSGRRPVRWARLPHGIAADVRRLVTACVRGAPAGTTASPRRARRGRVGMLVEVFHVKRVACESRDYRASGRPAAFAPGPGAGSDIVSSTERVCCCPRLCAGSACQGRRTAPRPDATADCRVAAGTLCEVTDRSVSRGTTREGRPLARRSIPHRDRDAAGERVRRPLPFRGGSRVDRRRLGFARIGDAPHTPRARRLCGSTPAARPWAADAPGEPVHRLVPFACAPGVTDRTPGGVRAVSRETREVRNGVAGPASASALRRSSPVRGDAPSVESKTRPSMAQSPPEVCRCRSGRVERSEP